MREIEFSNSTSGMVQALLRIYDSANEFLAAIETSGIREGSPAYSLKQAVMAFEEHQGKTN